MAIECNIAPFINIEFYLTGAWGEQRATHKHAGIDISTGQKSNVYNMFEGTVISVTHSGYGGGYRTEYYYSRRFWKNLAVWRLRRIYKLECRR